MRQLAIVLEVQDYLPRVLALFKHEYFDDLLSRGGPRSCG